MDIEVIKKNIRNLSEDNIVKFITDLIFKDIANIRSFNPNEMYYKDMLVYKYDETAKKHKVYKCKENVVTGPFDPNKWSEYSLASKGGGSGEIDIDEINELIEEKVNEILGTAQINATTLNGKTAEGFVQRKEIVMTNSDSKCYMIPLICLDNSVSTNYYWAFGHVYLYRRNLYGSAKMVDIQFIAGKQHGSINPLFEFSRTYIVNQAVEVNPVRFVMNGKPYFGVFVRTPGTSFDRMEFNGFSTNFDDINCIMVYDISSSTVLNTEMWESREDLTGEENMILQKEFFTAPYVHIFDNTMSEHRWYRVLHQGNITRSVNDPNNELGQDGDIWIKYEP